MGLWWQRNLHLPLIGMLSRSTSIESSIETSPKSKNRTALWPSNITMWHLPPKHKNINWKVSLHTYVHCRVHCQNMETTQMLNYRWMNQEVVIYILSEIICSCRKWQSCHFSQHGWNYGKIMPSQKERSRYRMIPLICGL